MVKTRRFIEILAFVCLWATIVGYIALWGFDLCPWPLALFMILVCFVLLAHAPD